MTPAASFREKFLKATSPLCIIGAHDGLGAKLIEQHGFDGVWASGLEISASHCVPDANILTMTQYLERAQEMRMASNLPVVADVDTGYGNSSNVRYMVELYEAAGIAAVVIEDKMFPKVNSFVPGRQELASIAEFCGKLAAAKAAKRSPDFLVIARVEALIAGWGMDEALKRAKAYMDAGADAILIHSKSKEPGEIRTFLTAWKKQGPIVLVPTTYPDLTFDEMKKLGVNMIIYANQCLRASITAMHDVLDVMQKTKSTVSIEKKIATVKEIFELQGMMAMNEHEKKYLRTQKTVHAIIPAAGKPNHEGVMAELLKERPIAMLDTEGKPLIQRIIESINLAGMQDVVVLGGYKGEMLAVESAEKRMVPSFEEASVLHSIEQAADKFTDSVLIHYGDVIVSHENLKSFLASDAPITIMISPLLREGRYHKKKFELVSLSRTVPVSVRTLERHSQNTVKAIGTSLDSEKADGEFIGLVLLNPAGVDMWKKQIEKLSAKEKNALSLSGFLQKLVDSGTEITTFESRTGWAEVHSEEDYRQLCVLLRSR